MKTNDSSSSPSNSQPDLDLAHQNPEVNQNLDAHLDNAKGSDSKEIVSSLGRRLSSKSAWSLAVLVMAAALTVVGLRAIQSIRAGATVDEEEVSPSRLQVRAIRAQTGLAQQWVFDEGVVTAARRRVLNFEAEGDIEFLAEVDGRDLREGDPVSQGQLLATIDDRKQNVDIDTAAADVEVTVRQQDQALAALLQAEADLDKARSDLRFNDAELARYQELFEQGAVSESQRDVYLNAAEQARANLRVAEQGVRAAEDDVQSAEASVDASQARLLRANVNLEDTQLVSPIDGVVAYINIREGEYWDTQITNTSGTLDDLTERAPIVVIEPQSFEVELELQANEAEDIRSGQQAYVVLADDVSGPEAAGATNRNLLDIARTEGSQGQVFAVSPTQTPGGRGVEVRIRNFQLVRNLQIGGRVYVWIEAASSPDTVILPLGSLQPRESGTYAFVVDESTGMVERRQVEVGIEALDGIEILSGVEPGELVVTEGINRLVDGTLVEVVSEEASL
ncbi:MAG: multidrug transporter [Cyanobacteria bacterium P01_D01_bin.128]